MLVLQVDCGDMRNADSNGIIVDKVGKGGKVSNTGAVRRLWQDKKC